MADLASTSKKLHFIDDLLYDRGKTYKEASYVGNTLRVSAHI